MDHDVEEARGIAWYNVGGGERPRRTILGKSRVSGS